jgi:hypothetical protein
MGTVEANGVGLTAYGDLGGFGAGAHTNWQVIGTLDCALGSIQGTSRPGALHLSFGNKLQKHSCD